MADLQSTSILTSVKKLLGIGEDFTDFDADIIMHINSVFTILNQMGVGPAKGYSISSNTETWGDYLQDDTNLEAVKSYVYFKVRLMFDPPTSSSVMDCMNRMISELEWRLNYAADASKLVAVEAKEVTNGE